MLPKKLAPRVYFLLPIPGIQAGGISTMTQFLKSQLNRTVLALAALAATLAPQALKADDPPSGRGACPLQNLTLSGSYVMSGTGAIVGVGPVASVGIATYDGQGNGTVTYTLSLNGMISKGVTANGVFTVNPDCSGSKTFGSGPTAQHYNFVITPDGSTLTWIVRDANVVLSGTAVRFQR
jgi:hypothetical protein